MNFPVFDLHCDTALRMIGKDLLGDISLRENNLHIDLNRAKTLPGYAQCFACYTTPKFKERYQVSPVVAFEREMGAILSQIEKNSDLISLLILLRKSVRIWKRGLCPVF